MNTARLSTPVFDDFLHGGLESDVVTTVFGRPGAGKTLFTLLCSSSCVKTGKNVIFIDTEGGFSVDRLSQVDADYENTISHMVFLKPVSFAEQRKVFARLKDLVTDSIGLIVVDSISMLYRLELGINNGSFELSRELGSQVALLTEISRLKNIPVLITNQVYANVESSQGIRMIGGDLMKYGSKCLVEFEILSGKKRKAVLHKHRSIESGRELRFEIVQTGVEVTKS